jgi:FdhE protein
LALKPSAAHRVPSPWQIRRARALRLAAEAPHAREILSTYADLVALQERVARMVPISRWLPRASSVHTAPPLLRLDRLPFDELAPLFADFVASAAELGTDVMRASAEELLHRSGADLVALLEAALGTRTEPDERSPFHVRAFLQPIATALVISFEHGGEDPRGARCFACDGAAVVAALQDLPDALGSRSLICGVCGGGWRLPRLVCARCGEAEPASLVLHTAHSLPHVRLEACESCGHYLKTVDLRQRGDAVPLVDDLATVELDLWARERGLRRAEANLFGL